MPSCVSPYCTFCAEKLFGGNQGIYGAAAGRRIEKTSHERLSEAPVARNGFYPKWLGMSSIAELRRWMGGMSGLAERGDRLQKLATCSDEIAVPENRKSACRRWAFWPGIKCLTFCAKGY